LRQRVAFLQGEARETRERREQAEAVIAEIIEGLISYFDVHLIFPRYERFQAWFHLCHLQENLRLAMELEEERAHNAQVLNDLQALRGHAGALQV
jgi:hypothetical protein